MDTLRKAVIVAGLLGITSAAYALQAAQAANAQSGLEDGSILYAELSKTVDAKKAKAGDAVSAALLADVLSHGKIVARRDSKLAGHVTEAQPHSKDNPESRLGIVFDKVILKGGQEIPLSAALIALRPAPRLQIEPMGEAAPREITSSPTQKQDRRYPMPMDPSAPISGNGTGPSRKDMNPATHGRSDEMRPSAIDGLSLEKSADGSNRVVVSLTQTVKLESGVRLELKTGAAKP